MSWIKFSSKDESLKVYTDIARLCSELGGDVSREVFSHIEKNDWLGAIDFKIDYETIDPIDAIYSRQIIALFSKLDFIELGIDKERVAFEKFRACEESCLEVNRRFSVSRPASIYVFQKDEDRVESILFLAQRKIANILGVCPSLEDLDPSFGPGANTNVLSRCANPRVKLSARLACSTSMTRNVGEFLSETPLWSQLHAYDSNDESYYVEVEVHHGKLSFVPKNARTDRSIVVEPLLNSFWQKAVGKVIRKRLMKSGVDLNDQTRNQELAKKGSQNGNLATLDLSSASDCIARGLVWSLLPLEWAELLDVLRTPSVEYQGEILHLEKFSSMGNAYTFELESLLFYSLAHSVCTYLELPLEDVSVFGDDIIIPVNACELLTRILNHCGFSVNLEKSFSTGSFRESCGADYLDGLNIRPFYPKTRVSERTLFSMHNWMMRNGEYELARFVHTLTHPHYRLYGPDGYGDGHLIGTYNLRTTRNSRRSQWDGGFFETYALKPTFFSKEVRGDYVFPTYSVYTRSGKLSPTDPNAVRGSRGYAKLSIYTLSNSVFTKGNAIAPFVNR